VLKTKYKLKEDVDLLELIRDFDDDFAYEEFVNRFHPIIEKECLNKCKLRNVDKHIGKQICHDTFDKVRTSKSFKKEKLNGKEARSAITGWLYRISSNLFYDYHNSQKTDINNVNESYFDDLIEYANEVSASSNAEIRDITENILTKLNSKEREVIITDFEYKRSQKYLPEDVNESLSFRLGVKKSSIRKIRERAIVKLKKAIDEVNK